MKKETMNPEIKKAWVEALRSGKYKQTRETLRDTTGKYHCCLGVLCDLYKEQNPQINSEWDFDGEFRIDSGDDKVGQIVSSGLPSFLVSDWAGLICGNPEVSINLTESTLANHNDEGKTFLQIADAIEEQL